jgi:2-polyprenyl-6-hydroxyphenyl methylase/3-demethylubiquinone-9 3-methyltransferase
MNADPAELARFEALASSWWDPSGPLRTLHEINPLRLQYIADRTALRDARVLDVGCGAGLLSEALAGAGARVTGIDLADASLNVARAHAAEGGLSIDYRNVAVEQVAADETSAYDLVLCLEVLEHVPDPAAIVAACARAACPGGRVVFSTINRNPKSFAFAILGAEYLLGLIPRGTHEYLKLIRPSELAADIRAAGLELTDLTGLHYNPLTRAYRLGGNVDVNYFADCRRAAAH